MFGCWSVVGFLWCAWRTCIQTQGYCIDNMSFSFSTVKMLEEWSPNYPKFTNPWSVSPRVLNSKDLWKTQKTHIFIWNGFHCQHALGSLSQLTPKLPMFSDLTILGNLIASRSTWGQRKTRRCWPLSCEVLRVEETCALEVGRLGGHGISLKVGNPCLEGNRLEPGVSKLQLASENLQLPAGFNQHILVTYDYPFLTHRHNTMHLYVGNVVMLMGRFFFAK